MGEIIILGKHSNFTFKKFHRENIEILLLMHAQHS